MSRQVVDDLATLPTSILSDCLDRFNCLGPELETALSLRGGLCRFGVHRRGNRRWQPDEPPGRLKYVQAGDVLVIDGKGVTTPSLLGRSANAGSQRQGRGGGYTVLSGRPSATRTKSPNWACRCIARGTSPARTSQRLGWSRERADQLRRDARSAWRRDGRGSRLRRRGSQVPGSRSAAQAAREKVQLEQQWFQRIRDSSQDTADFLGFMDKARLLLGVEIYPDRSKSDSPFSRAEVPMISRRPATDARTAFEDETLVIRDEMDASDVEKWNSMNRASCWSASRSSMA